MIILNEKQYAQDCLKNKNISDKPYYTLFVIAKYYFYVMNYDSKKITELLTDFISRYYPRYDCNKAMWDDNIENIVKTAPKHQLYEIDGVWITQAELKTIEKLNNKTLERLAFTLLCLAKLGNLKNDKNNGWVNNDAKEVYSLARIACSVSDRFERLGELHQLKMLEFPKRIDNLSCRVTYIDEDSEKVLFISDFRELGYEYLKYKGEKFIRCRECGRLVKDNKYGNKKYCSECAGYTPKAVKTVVCIDCGKEFEVAGNNKRTIRCKECQKAHIREVDRIRKSK